MVKTSFLKYEVEWLCDGGQGGWWDANYDRGMCQVRTIGSSEWSMNKIHIW